MTAGNTETATTCPYCGVGCGLRVSRFGDAVQVTGDPAHPANGGRLCAKGSQLGATVALDNRLLAPVVDGVESDWGTALDRVAERFAAVRAEHGPGSVAMYVSGQLLTEDYYAANKFMKGALASANIDTNSRLCMASAVAGHKRAFGEDTVPCGYDDVEAADLVVLVGSNLAWCHPVLYQRLQASREDGAGPMLVVLDPRRTATAAEADLHLAVSPGSDTTVFNGLLAWLAEHDSIDQPYVDAHTEGLDDALAAAGPLDLAERAGRCGVSAADLASFYRLFADSDRVVTVFSQGVNQSSVGTDKVNAIINVHLASGRIGRKGCGPFSITGQPNAMGGREVGGLANQLAAHMDFEADNVDRVRRFWGFGAVAGAPGLKAVDLFEAVGRGEIKALWVMGTNPAVSLPRSQRVREALAQCEFLVVSEVVPDTDTAAFADVLLPALAWGEKDGTVTNSERRISRQRAFLPAPGQARPDWQAIAGVARRMGFGPSFDWAGSAAIFREHAALSAFENNGARDFDIGALAALGDDGYDALEPVCWPFPEGGPPAARPVDIFADGQFRRPGGRARLVAVNSAGTRAATDTTRPLMLNSGRLRDQWHTMTRTARAPRLNRHAPEPCLYLHRADARRLRLVADSLVRVRSCEGQADLRLKLSSSVGQGQAFMPMHWSGPYASSALAGSLFAGALDPHSGQPELKAQAVSVEPLAVARHGLELLAHDRADTAPPHGADYWAHARLDHCEARFLGFSDERDDWVEWARSRLVGCDSVLSFGGDESLVLAGLVDERLAGLVLLGRQPRVRDVHWLAGLFAEAPLGAASRRAILAGMPPALDAPTGEGDAICACFGAGSGDIDRALEAGAASTAAIGAMVRAGSNCGACLPELRQVLDEDDELPLKMAAGE
ncbi:molybdopterin-dependent oxidoreductase [Marinihelvus fidelis]|uniref:Molybdopterin-dependent oxidoreductase n=1 Tax=Marinihelvus fidelis TaxID=2613842 RepID=A0A5N0T5T3_9GAMM|nr:nitrate reductase [Marinihelvus fidelis]KAA9129814.1 molybdopterin-dependent oxidoreductase [Marinihelvus fidelis]